MKIKDLVGKKIILKRNLGDEYYWNFQYVVEIDKDNVTLINESGSGSGWQPFHIESIEEEFISNFFGTGSYDEKFEKTEEEFHTYFDDEYRDYRNDDVIIISKNTILPSIKRYEFI